MGAYSDEESDDNQEIPINNEIKKPVNSFTEKFYLPGSELAFAPIKIQQNDKMDEELKRFMAEIGGQ